MTGPWIAAFLVTWIAVLVLLYLQLGQARKVLSLLEAIERMGLKSLARRELSGRAPGEKIAGFRARSSSGELVTSDDLLGSERLFLFLSADCHPCQELSLELTSEEASFEGAIRGVPLIAVVRSEEDAGALGLAESLLTIVDTEDSVLSAFDNSTMPRAFLIDSSGTVLRTDIPNRLLDLEHLVDSTEPLSAKGGDATEPGHALV